MNSDQIKAVAADFLRALATVPGLFARWQSEGSPSARALLVKNELGLALAPTAGEIARMAEYTRPSIAKLGVWTADAMTTRSILVAQAVEMQSVTA